MSSIKGLYAFIVMQEISKRKVYDEMHNTGFAKRRDVGPRVLEYNNIYMPFSFTIVSFIFR